VTLLSTVVLTAACAVAGGLWWRARSWRAVPVALLTFGLLLRQAAALLTGPLSRGVSWTAYPTAFGDLAIALLTLLTVRFMGRGTAAPPPVDDSLGPARSVLSRLLDASPAVIYSARPAGDYGPTYVSANVAAQLGHEARAFIENPGFWVSQIHPEDAPRVFAERRKHLFEGSDHVQEYRFRHADDSYRWVHDELRLVRDAMGNPELIVGSWMDVTESKELEARYLQAQKGEEVGRLAGGIAHDFNNLLNVIIGFSGLAKEKLGSDDPLRRDLELVCQAGAKATDLTRQLLDFSRHQVTQPRVLDLNAIVTDFRRLLRRTIEESVEITLDLDPQLGGVRADSGHMEQVLMNLAVNARDAMPRGGRLTIETSNVRLDQEYARTRLPVKPGEYVLLAVTDTGEGIEPETLQQIFEPFFTTKEPGKGTGLGLSTVYGIVKQSDGYIWPYSEPGKGTTFKVYLPRVEPEPKEVTSEETTTEPGGSETILIIEDQEAVRAFAVRALENRGYRVLAAENSTEALGICREQDPPIDLVVTDLVLPGGSGGVHLASSIREIVPTVKALFISGYGQRAAIQSGQLTEDADFLGKPFRATDLASKIREILDRAP
jgi:two-component system, cell cycle sensor histidine kinase and response regulator CckA